jgi:hypothetical protein
MGKDGRALLVGGFLQLAIGLLALSPATPADDSLNGFDLGGARVPREEIRAGGPPRDGIESVDQPEFALVEEARWVVKGNPVLGVVVEGDAHVYPVHLIEPHQIVNDEMGGVPVVVSYDPLTAAPRAYRRRIEERTLSFGVSGLIYNSNFLLYDRETESLWVQFTGEAVTGPMAGKRLERIPIRQELLGAWLARHPLSRVLVRPLPTRIDYRHSRYSRYMVEDKIIFPVKARDDRFHAKELVLGVVAGGRPRAYLGSLVTRAGGKVAEELRGSRIELVYSTDDGVYSYQVAEGVEVAESYWFAWKAFHPDTEVWSDPGDPSGTE